MGEEKKLTFKLKDKTLQYYPYDIDHVQSEHTTQVQSSKYLMIEHNLESLQKKMDRPNEIRAI